MWMLLLILAFVIIFSYLPSYSSKISSSIGSYFIQLKDEERNLRQQVRDLKAEQGSVSMTEEFAKYMKLQRKIEKLVEHIKKMGSSRSQKLAMFSMGVKIAINLIHKYKNYEEVNLLFSVSHLLKCQSVNTFFCILVHDYVWDSMNNFSQYANISKIGIVMISLIIMFKNEPLYMLPEEWFVPVSRIISFPSGIPGGIGVTCWILVCSSVVYRIKSFVNIQPSSQELKLDS